MFNDNGGSRTDTLIKLVLVFFLSLLSFSVGTFVGKQFSDSQHKIAEMESNGADSDRSTASISPDATNQQPGQAISEEEITKLSDEFVDKEKKDQVPAAAAPDVNTAAVPADQDAAGMTGKEVGDDQKPVAAQPSDDSAQKAASTVRDEIAAVSKRIASGEKVDGPKTPTSRVPSSLPKDLASSSIGKFTVQVSSHPSEGEAKTVAQHLKDKGLSAFYIPAAVHGKTWYRVSIGLFATRKEAMEYRTKLIDDDSVASAIVQKIMK